MLTCCFQWFRGTVQAGSSLQIADWWPIIRPLIRAVPYAINPIKKVLLTLHLMEENLWKGLVDEAREHVKHGRFYPSMRGHNSLKAYFANVLRSLS